MKIEKRLPIGFLGEYGTLYKLSIQEDLTTYNEELNSTYIVYNSANYIKVLTDLQLVDLSSNKDFISSVKNLTDTGEYKYFKTSDSFYNRDTEQWECCVNIGDIINCEKAYYICEKIQEKQVHTPKTQSIYYLYLKKIGGVK